MDRALRHGRGQHQGRASQQRTAPLGRTAATSGTTRRCSVRQRAARLREGDGHRPRRCRRPWARMAIGPIRRFAAGRLPQPGEGPTLEARSRLLRHRPARPPPDRSEQEPSRSRIRGRPRPGLRLDLQDAGRERRLPRPRRARLRRRLPHPRLGHGRGAPCAPSRRGSHLRSRRMSAPPRPEHPRPQLFRADWLSLNGEWGFNDDQDRVPALSGSSKSLRRSHGPRLTEGQPRSSPRTARWR